MSRTNADMKLDPGFSSMWPHVVTIRPKASYNNYGEMVAGTDRIGVCAYIDPPLTYLQRTAQRDERSYGALVYLADLDVAVQDHLILPNGQERVITSVEIYDYVEGLDHAEVRIE